MQSALIISSGEKSVSFFTAILTEAQIRIIHTVETVSAARRLLLERDFDLIVINAPLRDESGEAFAKDVSHKGLAIVILVVKAEVYEAMSAACENDGVLTVSKPVVRQVLWAALKLAGATHSQRARLNAENAKLKQKIEDIRVIDRAKCLLISYMSMSEKEAHRYIEKQAMDMRASKREIAEGILMTYEG